MGIWLVLCIFCSPQPFSPQSTVTLSFSPSRDVLLHAIPSYCQMLSRRVLVGVVKMQQHLPCRQMDQLKYSEKAKKGRALLNTHTNLKLMQRGHRRRPSPQIFHCVWNDRLKQVSTTSIHHFYPSETRSPASQAVQNSCLEGHHSAPAPVQNQE